MTDSLLVAAGLALLGSLGALITVLMLLGV